MQVLPKAISQYFLSTLKIKMVLEDMIIKVVYKHNFHSADRMLKIRRYYWQFRKMGH